MGKRILLFGVLSLLCCASIAAQQPSRARAAYEQWRAQMLAARPTLPPHRALATVTQRSSAERAVIEFYAVGEMTGLTLSIQPLRIEKQSDGAHRQEIIGEVTKSEVKGQEQLPMPVSLEVIVPAPQQANALAVEWTILGGAAAGKNTLIVALGDQAASNVTAIIAER